MDLLRRSGREDESVALLRKAVTAHPDLSVGLLAAFRAAGRQADRDLLLDVVAALDPESFARVVGALSSSRGFEDLESLLARLDARGLPELAAVAVAYEATASAAETGVVANPLMARLLARSAGEVAMAVVQLRRQGRDRETEDVIAAFSHAPSAGVRAVAVDLAKHGLRTEATTLLHRYALVAAPADAAEAFGELARGWVSAATVLAPILAGRRDSGSILAALRSAEPDRFPGALVGLLPQQHVVRLCRGLSAQNVLIELDEVLAWCAGRADVAELRSALHEAGLHAVGYRLAERIDELTG